MAAGNGPAFIGRNVHTQQVRSAIHILISVLSITLKLSWPLNFFVARSRALFTPLIVVARGYVSVRIIITYSHRDILN